MATHANVGSVGWGAVMNFALMLVGMIALLVVFLYVQHRAFMNALQRNTALEIRAASAETTVQILDKKHKALQDLEEVQREQTVQATQPEHLSKRADFAGDWLPGTFGDLQASSEVGAADAAGAADNQA